MTFFVPTSSVLYRAWEGKGYASFLLPSLTHVIKPDSNIVVNIIQRGDGDCEQDLGPEPHEVGVGIFCGNGIDIMLVFICITSF